MLRMSSQEEVEEVIHSEGEAFEEIYPDNTWDSDDALSDDDDEPHECSQ